MMPTDLETMVQNLNHRVTRIEQILTPLATRDDLAALATRDELGALEGRLREELASKSDLEALERRLRADLASKSDLVVLGTQLREELAERFEDAKRYALVLHEDLKSDIGLIAEHLADLMSRLPRRDH